MNPMLDSPENLIGPEKNVEAFESSSKAEPS